MHRLAQPGMLLPFKRFFLPYVHHAAGAVLQPRRGETTQHACCSVLWRTRSFVQPLTQTQKNFCFMQSKATHAAAALCDQVPTPNHACLLCDIMLLVQQDIHSSAHFLLHNGLTSALCKDQQQYTLQQQTPPSTAAACSASWGLPAAVVTTCCTTCYVTLTACQRGSPRRSPQPAPLLPLGPQSR